MVAVRVSPDHRPALVGAPVYFAEPPDADVSARPAPASLHQLSARFPSSRRMIVVSMCHISSGLVVRSPTFGFAGCTRTRWRRQPYFQTVRCNQVDGER